MSQQPMKRYWVNDGHLMSPLYDLPTGPDQSAVYLAADVEAVEAERDRLERQRDTVNEEWRKRGERIEELKHALAAKEAVADVPAKYDCSMTYRQNDKLWTVRYISWGQDQKMFTGESPVLEEAIHAAREQMRRVESWPLHDHGDQTIAPPRAR